MYTNNQWNNLVPGAKVARRGGGGKRLINEWPLPEIASADVMNSNPLHRICLSNGRCYHDVLWPPIWWGVRKICLILTLCLKFGGGERVEEGGGVCVDKEWLCLNT